ncbi:hypothetical protein ACG33_05045 [Steroidobacter denitrificans]|uniref:TonB-dependent receptor plug domain-containing protein n=2 Tax=Steroidobacter denitrificans TaxID=465721 RepID=A0A127F7Q1_STEDE|nr:hypothetical protein ACG33_05045 [Steroidobacter denitrificans]
MPSTSPRLEEIVVQSSRYTLVTETTSSHVLLTQEQIKNTPRLADETLRATQRLPGTAADGFSSLGYVRGGDINETAIVLDGLRLYEPFHLKDFLSPVSLLDSRLIEGIEFYSGGFPAPYGDRMSAVIDATTVRPGQPRYYELGLSLFHLSAMAAHEFADGRGHVLLSGRRGNAGDLAQFSEKDFGRPHYSDGFGRVDYQFNDRTRGTAQMLVSSDSITAFKGSGAQRAVAEYRNVYAWGTLQHEWSDSTATRLIVSYTDLSNERYGTVDEPGHRFGEVIDDRLFHVIGVKLDTSISMSALKHRWGVEVQRLWGRYDYALDLDVEPDFPFPGSPGFQQFRALAPQPKGYETSAYWDARFDLDKRWTVQAGIRVDRQTYDDWEHWEGSDENWSPRLAVLYRLDSHTQLRASWGRFFQPQGINELQVEDGIDRFYPAQRADHMIVSLDRELEWGADLRIELYRKRYTRLHPRFENLFDPLVLFPEAEFDRVSVASGAARAEGIELFLNFHQQDSWSGWLGYTWARVEDHVEGMNVPRSWDQRHTVNLGLVWSKGPWSATLAYLYHTGWPATQFSLSDGVDGPSLVTDKRNRDRLQFYSTLDFRLTRTFGLPRGALDVFVEATNALSRKNPCCIQYTIAEAADGSLEYSRKVDSWLPLVPSLGVLWRY